MERGIKKIYENLRSGEDIRKESQLSFDEIINKYYNLSEEKLDKNHICILRDLCNNDKEFDEVILFYRNISEDSKIVDYNKPCDNCRLNCCNNIDVNFNFYAAVFIMDLFNRRFSYNAEINKELANLFFKQFYIEENKVKFNEGKMINLFIDYDLEILDNELLQNDTLTNINALLKVKDKLLSIYIRSNNLMDEEMGEIKPHINFVNNKLEYYEKMYALEKEQLTLSLSDDENIEVENVKPKIKNTKSEIVLAKLNEYGFSELETLNDIKVKPLVEHIFNNTKIPYRVAYLWYLGFIQKIDIEQCETQKELHNLLGKIIDADERAVRGNINGIKQEKSTDRIRYTAHKHIEKVKKHYQTLK